MPARWSKAELLRTFVILNANMDTLKTLGIAGFLFFLLKGLLWLVLFALVARGVIPKERLEHIKSWFRWPFRKG